MGTAEEMTACLCPRQVDLDDMLAGLPSYGAPAASARNASAPAGRPAKRRSAGPAPTPSRVVWVPVERPTAAEHRAWRRRLARAGRDIAGAIGEIQALRSQLPRVRYAGTSVDTTAGGRYPTPGFCAAALSRAHDLLTGRGAYSGTPNDVLTSDALALLGEDGLHSMVKVIVALEIAQVTLRNARGCIDDIERPAARG